MSIDYQARVKDYAGQYVNMWITFTHSEGLSKVITYCTLIVEKEHKFMYYHDAVVWNGKDRFDVDAGDFLAFKKALYQRFIDEVHYMYPKLRWKTYYKHWGGFLWALKQDEVSNDYDCINSL